MFLSTQKPPNNPSSSSNFLHFTSSIDELDPLNLPTFAIRDYTYTYRTKNINNNWPFSSRSLQLCLKHVLLHPLPSFHPFNHVIRALHSMETSPLKNQFTPQEGFENDLLLPITSRSRSKSKSRSKKCRFTVNLGSKEDSFVDVSESMALRTCPICKSFSSASNTTLNVHIHQCLSVDSRQQPFSKPNRPLKVKLMTDIYASARECTLEDLDKINGTKWATVSSYSTDKSGMNKKEKNRRLLSVGMDEIGPVYIDARGQKLRILSAQARADEDVSEKKCFRDESKKKLRGKKLNSQSRRLNVQKSNISKIPEYERGYNNEEDRGKWESEMTQEHQLIDDDDDDGDEWDYNGETYEDDDHHQHENERFKENVIKGNDVLDCSKDTDAKFESMIYEKLGCKSAEIESELVQGSSLMEFDPIPIPGPPGSFLLSPWDVITDENLGNSSSQIQYSQDQLDFTDINSSESPVSAFSNTRLPTNSILSISDTILDQDLDLLSKSLNLVPAIPSNPVLRLMGKDLMIINQEESSRNLYIP